jgi:hypothetical protein
MRPPELFDVALTKAEKEIAHGVGAGESLDAQRSVEGLVRRSQSVCGRWRAPATTDHRDHKSQKGLGRPNGGGAVVGEGHQAADLPCQNDSLDFFFY